MRDSVHERNNTNQISIREKNIEREILLGIDIWYFDFFRYEYTFPCCLCGKKCVCDACRCSSEAWSHAFNCGFCTFSCWPLIDENDPTQGQKCCDAKCNLCCLKPMSYEPLIFHRVLGGVFNIIYVLIYFMNICNMFCLLKDTFVYKGISFVMSTAIRIFGF